MSMERLAPYQFKPGQSGNPKGRPKIPPHVRDLARAYTEDAVQVLANVMMTSDDDGARVKAAIAILDRAWGKPNPNGMPHYRNPTVIESELEKSTLDELVERSKKITTVLELMNDGSTPSSH